MFKCCCRARRSTSYCFASNQSFYSFTLLTRVPRAYISSRRAVGGNRDGRHDGENPYYAGKRGHHSDGGYTPEPGPYAGQ